MADVFPGQSMVLFLSRKADLQVVLSGQLLRKWEIMIE